METPKLRFKQNENLESRKCSGGNIIERTHPGKTCLSFSDVAIYIYIQMILYIQICQSYTGDTSWYNAYTHDTMHIYIYRERERIRRGSLWPLLLPRLNMWDRGDPQKSADEIKVILDLKKLILPWTRNYTYKWYDLCRYIYIYTCIYIYTYVYTYMHLYIHIYIHMYICMFILCIYLIYTLYTSPTSWFRQPATIPWIEGSPIEIHPTATGIPFNHPRAPCKIHKFDGKRARVLSSQTAKPGFMDVPPINSGYFMVFHASSCTISWHFTGVLIRQRHRSQVRPVGLPVSRSPGLRFCLITSKWCSPGVEMCRQALQTR